MKVENMSIKKDFIQSDNTMIIVKLNHALALFDGISSSDIELHEKLCELTNKPECFDRNNKAYTKLNKEWSDLYTKCSNLKIIIPNYCMNVLDFERVLYSVSEKIRIKYIEELVKVLYPKKPKTFTIKDINDVMFSSLQTRVECLLKALQT